MDTRGTVRLSRQAIFVCALVLFTATNGPVTVAEDGLIVAELNIGFPTTSFSTLNATDARAALQIWIDEVGRSRGFKLQGETTIFSNTAALYQKIREDRLDLVIINAWDYLEIIEEQLLRPLFIPAGQEAVLDHYLLLTRYDRKVSTLADLRGADIALLHATGTNYARPWLDTQIGDQGLGPIEAFFGSVTVADKISSAVLPVFFGKLDACVVDRSGFDTMRGMNPQLGRQLTALAVSPPLMETVICMHVHGHEYESEVVEALGELDLEPRGKQILMVFKIDRLVPFDPAYLDSLIMLREKYLEQTGAGDGRSTARASHFGPHRELNSDKAERSTNG